MQHAGIAIVTGSRRCTVLTWQRLGHSHTMLCHIVTVTGDSCRRVPRTFLNETIPKHRSRAQTRQPVLGRIHADLDSVLSVYLMRCSGLCSCLGCPQVAIPALVRRGEAHPIGAGVILDPSHGVAFIKLHVYSLGSIHNLSAPHAASSSS